MELVISLFRATARQGELCPFFAFSICGEPAEERRSVGEPAGKRSGGEPAEKRSEVIFLASQGQVLVFGMFCQHRANDEASFARELLPRTFGFAMGSAAVFVPQVEVFEFMDPVLFKALDCLFPQFLGDRVCRFSRLSHAGCPDSPSCGRDSSLRATARQVELSSIFKSLALLKVGQVGWLCLSPQSDGKAR